MICRLWPLILPSRNRSGPSRSIRTFRCLDPNIGDSKYNGVNVGIQKRYSQGVQFQANYTFSRFEDNADSYLELAGFPGDNSFTDYYNPKSRWGLSGSDIRHRVVVSGIYELPVGRGKKFAPESTVLNEAVGGSCPSAPSLSSIPELRSA